MPLPTPADHHVPEGPDLATAQRDLAFQLAAASDLKHALSVCLEAAMRVAGMDAGEIYLRDRDSGAVVPAQVAGFRPECATPDLAAIVQPAYSQARSACAAGRRDGCAETVRACAVIPILHLNEIIGWLAVRSHTVEEVPALSRGALESIAAQIGGALARLQAQEELAASQAQWKALFDSLRDFLIVADWRGRILEANRAVLDRLGYAREELREMHLAGIVSGDLRARLEVPAGDLLHLQLAGRDGIPVPAEIRLGLGTWNGQRVHIFLGRDLTEHWKAEEQAVLLREKTALLKEIHHRVKNNLQVISSLLSLQAAQLEREEDRAPFRESQARVQAIALLHERLYKAGDLSRIDFAEYLAVLAEHILTAGRRPGSDIHLRVQAEPVWLGPEAAMPCGLIVNELVTNSCKYAFPGGRSGEVYLSVGRMPGNRLLLQVGDNGIGLVPPLDARHPTTLGLQLVDDLVSQIKGSWTVESAGGTLFQIVFPSEAT